MTLARTVLCHLMKTYLKEEPPSMKKQLLALLFAVAVGATLSMPAFAQDSTQGTTSGQDQTQTQTTKKHHHKHHKKSKKSSGTSQTAPTQ